MAENQKKDQTTRNIKKQLQRKNRKLLNLKKMLSWSEASCRGMATSLLARPSRLSTSTTLARTNSGKPRLPKQTNIKSNIPNPLSSVRRRNAEDRNWLCGLIPRRVRHWHNRNSSLMQAGKMSSTWQSGASSRSLSAARSMAAAIGCEQK
jgi:hypothetical protein